MEVSERESDEVVHLVRGIEQDLDDAREKLTRLTAYVAAFEVRMRPRHPCPRCGVNTPSSEDLDWHLYNVHGDETAAERLGVSTSV